MNRYAVASAGSLLLLNTIASGGPILLSTYADTVSLFSPKNSAAEVQFILQLGDFPLVDPATGLGTGIWWGEGGDGYVDFAADNTPGFSEFASFVTNGIEDQFALIFGFKNGIHYGYVEDESVLLGRETDWVGYQIDLIRLFVSDIRFEPHFMGDVDNYVAYAGLKYEFYGAPIPEPSSLLLLCAGCGVVLGSGRQKHLPLTIRDDSNIP